MMGYNHICIYFFLNLPLVSIVYTIFFFLYIKLHNYYKYYFKYKTVIYIQEISNIKTLTFMDKQLNILTQCTVTIASICSFILQY